MKHYFQAEQLKYRHTSVAAITFGMPVFMALLAFWLTSSYFSIDVYNWWYIGPVSYTHLTLPTIA